MLNQIDSILPRLRAAASLAVLGLALCAPLTVAAQTAPRAVPIPLPPMGWSSWNSFSNTVDSEIIQAQAQAMISSGMHKAGYEYINIDEGWWLGQRDSQGNILVDPRAWPAIAPGEKAGDMANIVRFLHGLGLKAGIYTDAGADGCSTVGPDLGPSYPHTGSEGHYEQDFLQFARWGFDYVKVDWCGGFKENLDPAVQYAEIARALARAEAITGHRLYFSICNWGKDSPWTWAPNVGGVSADIWRTGGDIVDPIVVGTKNADRKAKFKEVLREFDQAQHPEAQHTGFYNDPDMMVVGMPGLTDAQNRAHMSLWAISGGPLLVGADLTKVTPADLATLTNRDLLRVDQDPLGLQPVKAAEPAPGVQVWSKPLATAGERAVLLLNRTEAAAEIAVRWSDLGLREDMPAAISDAWSAKNLGEFPSSYSATVPAGDAVMLLIRGQEAPMTSYRPELARRPATMQATPAPGSATDITFERVSSRFPVARVRVSYSNPENSNRDKIARYAELRVNGQVATRIAFPPASGGAGVLWIESPMNTSAPNTLTFSPLCGPAGDGSGPAIRSISVQ